MGTPQPLDGAQLQADADIEPYVYVGLLDFPRPLYLKVLTVLLVLLVMAAAAYAVFLRPLDQLIINVGGPPDHVPDRTAEPPKDTTAAATERG